MSETSTRKHITVEGEFNGEKISFETGRLAPKADAAVMATVGGTSVLVTVVSAPTKEIQDGLPLRVDYEERFYAGGMISGSRFTRREGKPTDEAIVEGRLIDHAIRPLFNKDFMDEVQIVATALSVDGKNSAGLVAFLATSAALSIAGLPFNGPIVPVRVQKEKKGGDLIVSFNESNEHNYLDLVASYLKEGKKVQAIEAHAHEIPEAELTEAIEESAKQSKPLFDLLNEFSAKVNVPMKEYEKSWLSREAIEIFHSEVFPLMKELHEGDTVFKSHEWDNAIKVLERELIKKYADKYEAAQVEAFVGEAQKDFLRDLAKKDKRIDDRGLDEIRPLSAEVGLIPRVHGSALFNRGFTQSLSITTLASKSQNLLVQTMTGEKEKLYMHHYNFPPFSTGEIGKVGGANRRAIGHGLLAEKALVPVLPDTESFGYAMRVVSEILSSNGSTSMAATCASSLALMDAGVPIKAHVGGIGVGLFVDTNKEDPSLDEYKLFTDIVGAEDFAGYMDYKMTGTREGVTAIQMELKLKGLPVALMGKLIERSRNARMKVLDVMDSAIAKPRETVNEYAPKLLSLKIDKENIGMVIGSGGVMIKGLMEQFDVEIDITEDQDYGMVSISGISKEKVQGAYDYILGMVTPVEVGEVYKGIVTRVEPYGAFIEIAPNQIGLLHVSEYSYGFTDDITNLVKVGDQMEVKVTGKEMGKISVSKKALEQPPEGYVPPMPRERMGGRDDRRGGDRRGGRGGDRGGRGGGRRFNDY